MQMRSCLGMHGNVIAAGLGEGFEIGIASKTFLVCGRIALMTSGP
jgi:hypothetical protein